MAKDLSRVRMLVLDVDGVLTDGGVYLAEDGSHMKRFAIEDGAGIKELLRCGLRVAIVSGHESKATAARFSKLGVEDVHTGVADKRECLRGILALRGLAAEECAAMGDDLMDVPMLRMAGWAGTVPDAHPRVRRIADYVTRKRGGHGAVREVAEMILKARGLFGGVLERYEA